VRKARLAFGARVQVFGAAAMNRGALCGPAEENTMALYGRGKN